MTIQITRPELAALIHQRMESGAFRDAEDVILQALQAAGPVRRADDIDSRSLVFERGLGLFGSPEDAALLDEVVSIAYADRRRLR